MLTQIALQPICNEFSWMRSNREVYVCVSVSGCVHSKLCSHRQFSFNRWRSLPFYQDINISHSNRTNCIEFNWWGISFYNLNSCTWDWVNYICTIFVEIKWISIEFKVKIALCVFGSLSVKSSVTVNKLHVKSRLNWSNPRCNR